MFFFTKTKLLNTKLFCVISTVGAWSRQALKPSYTRIFPATGLSMWTSLRLSIKPPMVPASNWVPFQTKPLPIVTLLRLNVTGPLRVAPPSIIKPLVTKLTGVQ